MSPRPPAVRSITVALCVSLLVHGAIVWRASEEFAAWGTQIYLPGLLRRASESRGAPLVIALPADDPSRRLGKADASGTAIDDSPGDEAMLARQSFQDQPLLRREPGGPQSAPVSAAGTDNSAIEAVAAVAASAPERPVMLGVGAIEPNNAEPRLASADQSAMAREAANGKQSPARQASSGAAVAPQGESDSDAVSTIGSVTFKPGGTLARIGRKHKLTHPRIGMAGMVDAVQLGRIRLVLKITIGPDGNVKRADIEKSSGSSNIDQACRVTAYEWWFEPQKGKGGVAGDETFLFVITSE